MQIAVSRSWRRRRVWGRGKYIDRLVEHGPVLFRGLILLSLNLHLDRLIEHFDDGLSAIIHVGGRGSLKRELFQAQLGVQLYFFVSQRDFARGYLLDRTLRANGPAVWSNAARFK